VIFRGDRAKVDTSKNSFFHFLYKSGDAWLINPGNLRKVALWWQGVKYDPDGNPQKKGTQNEGSEPTRRTVTSRYL
jgi:hypothetical protein